MEIFLAWLIFSVAVGVYAGHKGRSGVGFFFLSLLLSPLIGFIIAAVSSPNRENVAERSGLKKCPACAEYIQLEAQVCRFCRHEFVPVATPVKVANDVVPQLVPTSTWGPKLGSGSANFVKWCKRNPVWFFVLLIVAVAIVWSTAKRSNEQTARLPPAATEGVSRYEPTAPETRPTPQAQEQPSGNNSEAVSFAKDMTTLNQQTWPKAQAVWDLVLTPQQIKSDIPSYRRSVTYCSATITMSNEWLHQSEGDQRGFIKSSLDVLHRGPAIQIGPLDNYPNSSGQVVIKVGSKVVARGIYTPTKTGPVNLEPETHVQDKPIPQYTAELTIVSQGGTVSFQGTTDLPNSESILFTLSGHGYSGQAKATVTGGEFSTETFTNEGGSLHPGTYSLKLNVFNPMTGLMIEGRHNFELLTTRTLSISFKPVNLGE